MQIENLSKTLNNMLNDEIGLPPINNDQKRIKKMQKVNLKSLG